MVVGGLAPLFVVSMDLLYHFFISSAIISRKVSELNRVGANNSPVCALVYLNGEDNYGVVFITGNQNELTASYEEAELNINFNSRIHGSAIFGGSISNGTKIRPIY